MVLLRNWLQKRMMCQWKVGWEDWVKLTAFAAFTGSPPWSMLGIRGGVSSSTFCGFSTISSRWTRAGTNDRGGRYRFSSLPQFGHFCSEIRNGIVVWIATWFRSQTPNSRVSAGFSAFPSAREKRAVSNALQGLFHLVEHWTRKFWRICECLTRCANV